MGVNPHIRFGISKSGHYILDCIPTEEVNRYLHRLQNYSVNYKVVNRDAKLELTQQQICYLLFFDIEKALVDKLKTAYGLIDKRKHSVPISKNMMCFIKDDKYMIAFNKDLSHQMTTYFNQHMGFTYKLISVGSRKICIPVTKLSNVILEDMNNSIGITNEYDSNEETKKQLSELNKLINKYQKEIIANKQKQAFFNVGSSFGYPQR